MWPSAGNLLEVYEAPSDLLARPNGKNSIAFGHSRSVRMKHVVKVRFIETRLYDMFQRNAP